MLRISLKVALNYSGLIIQLMKNINIVFVAASDRSQSQNRRRVLDLNKSVNVLASKTFNEVDYIFEEQVQHKHRNIQRQHSSKIPYDSEVTIEAYKKELQRKVFIYKSMMMNMHRSFLQNKEIPKKQVYFVGPKDRTQIIHSHKSPKCHFVKRNSLVSSNSSRSQRRVDQREKLINLINPQSRKMMRTPEGRRMSLSVKNERSVRVDLQEEFTIFSKRGRNTKSAVPQSPKRKFWNKDYRPWSPQKRKFLGTDELSATIHQFSMPSQ